MAKILKRGQLPDDRKYRITCYNCTSELEFEQKEGKRQSDQRDGDYFEFTCPVCKHLMTASASSYLKETHNSLSWYDR